VFETVRQYKYCRTDMELVAKSETYFQVPEVDIGVNELWSGWW
jgi:hypothetical protein